MILVVFAHPYPDRSFANRALLEAVDDRPDVEVRSLYDRYPDFDIDAAAEREAMSRADVVVWQHPIYWYNVPALMKLWFERVLTSGWAWGPGGVIRWAKIGDGARGWGQSGVTYFAPRSVRL